MKCNKAISNFKNQTKNNLPNKKFISATISKQSRKNQPLPPKGDSSTSNHSISKKYQHYLANETSNISLTTAILPDHEIITAFSEGH